MEPLEDYLKKIYPGASKARIKQYIEWIENYEVYRLPPTKATKLYKKKLLKLEALQKEVDDLRLEVIAQKERLNHDLEGINISQVTSKRFNDSIFYDWVESIVDQDILDQITVKTIDNNKFKKLASKGLIRYDDLPDDVYTESTSWRVAIDRKGSIEAKN
jgi:DNA-directed RNA polymerase beta' subunit